MADTLLVDRESRPVRKRSCSRDASGWQGSAFLPHRASSILTLPLPLPQANPLSVSQLWEPYTNSPTFTYAAEETLDLDLVWGESFGVVEASNIADVYEVGKYFGSWWETTGTSEPCFVLSAEWRARYPDD